MHKLEKIYQKFFNIDSMKIFHTLGRGTIDDILEHNSWGAIELMQKYHYEILSKLDHNITMSIPYWDDLEKSNYDIHHVHYGNIGVAFKDRKIPYIFTLHDTTPYRMGKDSKSYQVNYEAIHGASLNILTAPFLLDYFTKRATFVVGTAKQKKHTKR